MKLHSTNYFDTFIEVAEDTKATYGKQPLTKDTITVAAMQYALLTNNPYIYTSDDVLFQVFANKSNLKKSDYQAARQLFFSKGQACLRASPLTKTYGFGIHADSEGKIALYGMETQAYAQFQSDDNIIKIKAMRNARKQL